MKICEAPAGVSSAPVEGSDVVRYVIFNNLVKAGEQKGQEDESRKRYGGRSSWSMVLTCFSYAMCCVFSGSVWVFRQERPKRSW